MTKQCEFDGCERKVTAKGLCSGHYQQQLRGVDLRPVRKHALLGVTEEGRVCTTCGVWKTWDNYYPRQGGYKSKCKPCVIERNTILNHERLYPGKPLIPRRARVYK